MNGPAAAAAAPMPHPMSWSAPSPPPPPPPPLMPPPPLTEHPGTGGGDTARGDASMSTCYVYFFKLAWHGSLATIYSHIFILLLAFIDKRYARLVYTRVALGYVVNIAFVLLGWLLLRDTFSCRVIAPMPVAPPGIADVVGSGGGTGYVPPPGYMVMQLYTNPLAYPALDGVLLGVIWCELGPRFAYMSVRKRMLVLVATFIGMASMFWFHRAWHILLSLAQGAVIQHLWGFFIQRLTRGSIATGPQNGEGGGGGGVSPRVHSNPMRTNGIELTV